MTKAQARKREAIRRRYEVKTFGFGDCMAMASGAVVIVALIFLFGC